MKTFDDIAQESAIRKYVASSGQLTDNNTNSVNTAMTESIAAFLSEVSLDSDMAIKNLFIATATVQYLDSIGVLRYGKARYGPQRGGLICWFYGTVGSTIPAGTLVTNIAGDVEYETINEATITSSHHQRIKVDCVCARPGSLGKVTPYTLTKFVDTAPAGITAVQNRMASSGNTNEETDGEYRARLVQSREALSQETHAFFETICKEVNEEVVRAFSRYDGLESIKVYVVRRNGTVFSAAELSAIEVYVDTRLKASASRSVTVENVTFTDIEIDFAGLLEEGTTNVVFIERVATRLDDYLSVLAWEPGKNVDTSALISEIYQAGGLLDVVEASFQPASDTYVSSFSLPRVISIKFTNSAGGSTTVLNEPYVAY